MSLNTLSIDQINEAFLSLPPSKRTSFADHLADEFLKTSSKADLLAELNESLGPAWPEEYTNRDTGKVYVPHNDDERKFVYSDVPRYFLCKGGEGSGKSVAGIVKMLDRVKKGCNGIMVSPTLPHFKVSLWKECRRWIPWDQVVPKHQERQKEEWEPYGPFTLVFKNGATLECRGIDNEGSCEGPNVNFVFFDEARHKPTGLALKVLDGRVRIPVTDFDTGEIIPPQIWLTSTPRKHWMFDYFGPLQVVCADCGSSTPIPIQEGAPFQCVDCASPNLIVDDEYDDFKRDSHVITLSTKDNEGNIQDDFAAKRAQTLTEAEARVLLDAQWEDIEEGQPYLPHISWWDDCEEPLSPLGEREMLVLGVDAATGRTSGESDCFAIVGVTRHPDPKRKKDSIAVRYVKTWQAKKGGKIDYRGSERDPGPERELLRLCGWRIDEHGEYVRARKKPYNVRCIVYDPAQLHDMGMRFSRARISWMKQFGQMNLRVMSDTDLLMLIQERRIAHSGNSTLRQHIYNADRKQAEDGKRLRMVKRSDRQKIDASVALSMAAYWCLYLQLGG